MCYDFKRAASCRRKHLGSSCEARAMQRPSLFRHPLKQSVSALPLVSDVDLLGDRESVVHLDTEISNGAFDLSVSKKQLHASQIARATIDQRRFCSTKRMGWRCECRAAAPAATPGWRPRGTRCRAATRRSTAPPTHGQRWLRRPPPRAHRRSTGTTWFQTSRHRAARS